MADLVNPEQIEQIVGAARHPQWHIARAVSSEERVYVLHSNECKVQRADLRDCLWSLALDNGIDLDQWEPYQDQPMRVIVADDRLVPIAREHVFIAGRCTHCNADGHSIGESDFCPVDGADRKTSWTFGPDHRDEVEG